MSNFWDQSNFNFVIKLILKSGGISKLQQISKNQTVDWRINRTSASVLDATPLMLIPSYLGSDIVERTPIKNDLLIFGAVYAGFIDEYSSRRECMPLNEYVNAAKDGGLTYFQKLFLERVVERDSAYYGKIKSLIQNAGVEPSLLVLSDLCRNSIVERRVVNNKRRDSSEQ